MSQPNQPVVILNPQAAGGRASKRWPRIAAVLADKLGPVEPRFTEHPGHATQLVRQALMAGRHLIIAVGGDGTINEAANGFLSGGEPVNPDASLGIIPIGTGGDFQRSVRIPSDIEEAVETIAGGAARTIDVGAARMQGHDGQPVERCFVNLTSFGMGGEVCVRSRNILSPLGGKTAFLYATFAVFLTYRAKRGAPDA